MKTKILVTFRWLLFPLSFVLAPLAKWYINHFPFKVGKVLTWKLLALLGKKFQVKVGFGAVIDGRTDDLVQRCIYCFGVWERDLSHFIQSRAGNMDGRIFVDVGANIGYYSMLVASVSSKINVVSIEAFPATFDKLNSNINRNDYSNVKAMNVAVVDKTCSVPMYYAGAHNEGATTSKPGVFDSEPVMVDGLTLADILTESELGLTRLIKIDTEGAEYAVLKGMASVLNMLPEDVEVVVEINPDVLIASELDEVFAMFETIGFSAYKIRNLYGAKNYLFHDGDCVISKLSAVPTEQTDVLFSKNEIDVGSVA